MISETNLLHARYVLKQNLEKALIDKKFKLINVKQGLEMPNSPWIMADLASSFILPAAKSFFYEIGAEEGFRNFQNFIQEGSSLDYLSLILSHKPFDPSLRKEYAELEIKNVTTLDAFLQNGNLFFLNSLRDYGFCYFDNYSFEREGLLVKNLCRAINAAAQKEIIERIDELNENALTSQLNCKILMSNSVPPIPAESADHKKEEEIEELTKELNKYSWLDFLDLPGSLQQKRVRLNYLYLRNHYPLLCPDQIPDLSHKIQLLSTEDHLKQLAYWKELYFDIDLDSCSPPNLSFFFNTHGGNYPFTNSIARFIDENTISARTNIKRINIGDCWSAGNFVFCMGGGRKESKKYALKGSNFMLHESWFNGGFYDHESRDAFEYIGRLIYCREKEKDRREKKIAFANKVFELTREPIDSRLKRFSKDLAWKYFNQREAHLSPDQAQEIGLVDEIIKNSEDFQALGTNLSFKEKENPPAYIFTLESNSYTSCSELLKAIFPELAKFN